MKVPRAVQNTKFLLNQRHDHAAEKNGVATSSLDDRSAQERNRPANQLRWIGVVILLAAFAVRAYNLGGTSLWFDEAVAVINSNHPFGEMIQQARGNNTTPIVLPTLWWLFGNSVHTSYTIRFLPLMFGLRATKD